VRQRNLPLPCEEMRKVCHICRRCAELKPSFFKLPSQTLIQTVRPGIALSFDFKGRDIGPNIGVAKGSPGDHAPQIYNKYSYFVL